jgi:hypothetical protein
MLNSYKRVFASWIFIIILLNAGILFADGGEECWDKRPKTAAEKKAVEDVIAVFTKAIPAPPKDWKLREAGLSGTMNQNVYTTKGCPASYVFKAMYTNDKNALAAAQNMNANADRLSKIMEEFQAAVAKNDAKRIQELNAQMQQIQKGGGATSMHITIEVNAKSHVESVDKAQPYNGIPGVPQAYLFKDTAEPRVVMFLGDSWKPFGKSVSLRIRKEISNVEPQMIFIEVSGSLAEEFAKSINIGAIKSILK